MVQNERWKKKTELQNRKKKVQNNVVFKGCLLNLQVIQCGMPPHWRAHKNYNVGFGITFICRFLNSYFAFRDNK